MRELRTVCVGTKFIVQDAAPSVAETILNLLGKLGPGSLLSVARDRANRADPNAVAVCCGTTHIGYVPKNQYGPILVALDRGLIVTAELTEPVQIVDGNVKAPPHITVMWPE